MKIDLYSERVRQQSSGGIDVFQYDSIPPQLRVQISQIAMDAIGQPTVKDTFGNDRVPTPAAELWRSIRDVLTREYGVHSLAGQREPVLDVLRFLEGSATAHQCLDVIELICRAIAIAGKMPKYNRDRSRITQTATDALDEINHRLRRAGCGYQVEHGTVFRVDSQFAHGQIVLPALQLLTHPDLQNANQEFLSAHEHYRNAKYESALVDAAKSLESTLKAICASKGWSVAGNATLKPLLDAVIAQQLLPRGVLDHVSAIRATLEQGVPYLRNNFGGHGKGTGSHTTDEELCAYCLHLAASAILLLVKAAGMGNAPVAANAGQP